MLEKLTQSDDDLEAVGGEDTDESSDDLEKMASTPASELYVRDALRKQAERLRRHAFTCPVKKTVRSWRHAFLFAAGIAVCGQVLGVITIRYIAKDLIRQTVLEVLREKVISFAEQPAVAAFAELEK